MLWRDSITGTVAMWFLGGLNFEGSATVGAVPGNWSIAGTADFNGDGKGDILWRDTNTGTVAVWLMTGGTIVASGAPWGAIPNNWVIAGTGDFNRDGTDDILWRNTNSGLALWTMSNGQMASNTGLPAPDNGWQIQHFL